jgi:hypothetical protein
MSKPIFSSLVCITAWHRGQENLTFAIKQTSEKLSDKKMKVSLVVDRPGINASYSSRMQDITNPSPSQSH